MGPRGPVTPDDGIRYSLLPSTTSNTPKGGVSRKLHFNFAAEAEIHDKVNGENAVNGDYVPTAVLYADYIYLDSDERRRYAQSAHEYLIEQVQFTGDENVDISSTTQKSQNIRLNFNHPVKYLAWVVAHKDRHGLFNTKEEGEDADQFAPLRTAKLLLNGHDRFSQRYGSYFNQVQPYQHWQSKPAAGVYAYSFALRPADQTLPSGSCNFSRIDNATLQLTFKQASLASNASITDPENTTIALDAANKLESLRIYAVNYNVLRVLSGMGGLAYLLMRRKGARTSSWIKRIRGNSFSNRSTLQPLVGGYYHDAPCNTSKLRGTPDSFTYQRMTSERPSWQRMELWYGKNREDWKIRSRAATRTTIRCPHAEGSTTLWTGGWNEDSFRLREILGPFQILRKEGYHRL